jgi:hypothetical protein
MILTDRRRYLTKVAQKALGIVDENLDIEFDGDFSQSARRMREQEIRELAEENGFTYERVLDEMFRLSFEEAA